MGEAAQLEKRIRIPRNEKVTPLQFIETGGVFYAIWRVRHLLNAQGIKVTDLTLQSSTEGG